MNLEEKKKWACIFLRVGLAAVFLYAAIASLIDPVAWEGFIPAFIKGIVDVHLFSLTHSIFEIILALWLLWGKKVYYPATIGGLEMLAVMLFNLGIFDVLFRDIAIFFAAAALVILTLDD